MNFPLKYIEHDLSIPSPSSHSSPSAAVGVELHETEVLWMNLRRLYSQIEPLDPATPSPSVSTSHSPSDTVPLSAARRKRTSESSPRYTEDPQSWFPPLLFFGVNFLYLLLYFQLTVFLLHCRADDPLDLGKNQPIRISPWNFHKNQKKKKKNSLNRPRSRAIENGILDARWK